MYFMILSEFLVNTYIFKKNKQLERTYHFPRKSLIYNNELYFTLS